MAAEGASMPDSKREIVSDLVRDLTGQVTEAILSAEYYSKWGRHYLPSLVRAHEMQQANNFKDPGIQHYGGSIFKSIRDVAEDIYVSLPPPKSTAPKPYIYSSSGSSSSGSSSSSSSSSGSYASSMSNYHNRSGGCVGGNSIIKLENGVTVLAQNVKKGDILSSGGRIKCVWKTDVLNSEMLLCTLPSPSSGLIITPYHPVVHNGSWTFPASIIEPVLTHCDSLYSFLVEDMSRSEDGNVLEHGHRYMPSIEASGIECIALCHGIENDAVATHPFFGTSRVVENLSLSYGWKQGLVTVRQKVGQDIFVRDEATGLVKMIMIDDLDLSSNTGGSTGMQCSTSTSIDTVCCAAINKVGTSVL